MRRSRARNGEHLYASVLLAAVCTVSAVSDWILQDAEDRSVGVQIQQALLSAVRLELFPKSTIDVFVTIIENDGLEGCISAGSVAASAALADAGIDMLGLVVSCSAVCRFAQRSDLWMRLKLVPVHRRKRYLAGPYRR